MGEELYPIIGKSSAINRLRRFIELASRSDATVLILGETGVGKELAARNIHLKGPRRERPFVKINSANLNDSLLESDLFGHKRGAFTSAFSNKTGIIESATGGSFFFDEIGELSPTIQGKLLSVVEDKEIRRIGDTYFLKIDTRFIFATNKSLEHQVSIGKFRRDLYYRINILTFSIPPLRERKEDIPQLVDNILIKESHNRCASLSLDPDALEELMRHSFPGNVRELENVLKRASELSTGGHIQRHQINCQGVLRSEIKRFKIPPRINTIVRALVVNKGNKTKAAKELGMSRTQLYRILMGDKEGR
jgi:transcriptional regulator with GAF, ATPase, and Fis domain